MLLALNIKFGHTWIKNIRQGVLNSSQIEQNKDVFLNSRVKQKLLAVNRNLNVSNLTESVINYPGKLITKFVLLNPTICRDTDHVDVIIIVHTKPDHFDKRQRMRDSYAKRSNFFPSQVRVAFLLGLTTNDTKLDSQLLVEHLTYNDTVQVMFKFSKS